MSTGPDPGHEPPEPLSEDGTYYLIDRATGLPAGVLDVDQLVRQAARIALGLAEAAGCRERVHAELMAVLAEHPAETKAYLLPLVISELLGGELALALAIGLEVRPTALDELRERAS